MCHGIVLVLHQPAAICNYVIDRRTAPVSYSVELYLKYWRWFLLYCGYKLRIVIVAG